MRIKEAFKQAEYNPKITCISLLRLKIKETKKGYNGQYNFNRQKEN